MSTKDFEGDSTLKEVLRQADEIVNCVRMVGFLIFQESKKDVKNYRSITAARLGVTPKFFCNTIRSLQDGGKFIEGAIIYDENNVDLSNVKLTLAGFHFLFFQFQHTNEAIADEIYNECRKQIREGNL